jgi:hypothetical protein
MADRLVFLTFSAMHWQRYWASIWAPGLKHQSDQVLFSIPKQPDKIEQKPICENNSKMELNKAAAQHTHAPDLLRFAAQAGDAQPLGDSRLFLRRNHAG